MPERDRRFESCFLQGRVVRTPIQMLHEKVIIAPVTTTADDLPDDIVALQAALIAERERAARVEAELR